MATEEDKESKPKSLKVKPAPHKTNTQINRCRLHELESRGSEVEMDKGAGGLYIKLTSVTSMRRVQTVGHKLRPTPTNGHGFTAYGLLLVVTHSSILATVDVP
jgi:hypothetical protein